MKLKEGETICPECKGKGHFQDDHNNIQTCEKCKGYGKLDWVEMVVGKSSWRVEPGVYVKEIDLSAMIPNFEQSTKEIEDSIRDILKIPKELMISEDE